MNRFIREHRDVLWEDDKDFSVDDYRALGEAIAKAIVRFPTVVPTPPAEPEAEQSAAPEPVEPEPVEPEQAPEPDTSAETDTALLGRIRLVLPAERDARSDSAWLAAVRLFAAHASANASDVVSRLESGILRFEKRRGRFLVVEHLDEPTTAAEAG